jgi:hypothetical protein
MGAVAFVVLALIWAWFTLPYPARAEFSAWFWLVLIVGGVAGFIGSLL